MSLRLNEWERAGLLNTGGQSQRLEILDYPRVACAPPSKRRAAGDDRRGAGGGRRRPQPRRSRARPQHRPRHADVFSGEPRPPPPRGARQHPRRQCPRRARRPRPRRVRHRRRHRAAARPGAARAAPPGGRAGSFVLRRRRTGRRGRRIGTRRAAWSGALPTLVEDLAAIEARAQKELAFAAGDAGDAARARRGFGRLLREHLRRGRRHLRRHQRRDDGAYRRRHGALGGIAEQDRPPDRRRGRRATGRTPRSARHNSSPAMQPAAAKRSPRRTRRRTPRMATGRRPACRSGGSARTSASRRKRSWRRCRSVRRRSTPDRFSAAAHTATRARRAGGGSARRDRGGARGGGRPLRLRRACLRRRHRRRRGGAGGRHRTPCRSALSGGELRRDIGADRQSARRARPLDRALLELPPPVGVADDARRTTAGDTRPRAVLLPRLQARGGTGAAQGRCAQRARGDDRRSTTDARGATSPGHRWRPPTGRRRAGRSFPSRSRWTAARKARRQRRPTPSGRSSSCGRSTSRSISPRSPGRRARRAAWNSAS